MTLWPSMPERSILPPELTVRLPVTYNEAPSTVSDVRATVRLPETVALMRTMVRFSVTLRETAVHVPFTQKKPDGAVPVHEELGGGGAGVGDGGSGDSGVGVGSGGMEKVHVVLKLPSGKHSLSPNANRC